ncbi:CvpA family protein [Mechercharimyces sp. CAU 1602]|uniref:CvpA family protein n=1 Tax=Mechercharimyces sp. CAU 1602 TaxID=2973933 RepID=UPI002163669A|nr:CvpA family protein [Mechercharimyces sp. CAU 1602]MCS1351551.1 CvpA family protein [Mechercharimyces sp. CAU 1602]
MNVLDGLIICFIGIRLLRGYRLGFVLQVASMINMMIAVLFAYSFKDDFVPILKRIFSLPQAIDSKGLSGFIPVEDVVYHLLAFFFLYVMMKVMLSLVTSAINRLTQLPVLSTLNGLSGLALASLQAVFILLIGLNLFSVLPHDEVQVWLHQSVLAPYFLQWGPELVNMLLLTISS